MTQNELILGKYEVLEEVGRGGMGIVYRAKDVRIERIVAIKELIISPGLVKEKDEIVGRFHREARTAGSLQHPNIVTIHDFGEDNDRHFIAMEFLEGKSLKDFIDEEHKFTDDELIDMLVKICDGLQHAHDRTVIHRDIKPDNISIMKNGTPKITDFGIARMTDSMVRNTMTQDGTMLGTLGYISPEQLQDAKSVDQRTDIFSLGAMMYEMYTNQLPFDGGNVGATILKIVSENPKPPSQINSEISPEIEEVIMKALEKDPNKRYQSVVELSEALKTIKFGKKNKAGESSGVEQISCKGCGTEVAGGSKFCPNCGSPMTAEGKRVEAKAPPEDDKVTGFKSRLAQLTQITNTYQKKSDDAPPAEKPRRRSIPTIPPNRPKSQKTIDHKPKPATSESKFELVDFSEMPKSKESEAPASETSNKRPKPPSFSSFSAKNEPPPPPPVEEQKTSSKPTFNFDKFKSKSSETIKPGPKKSNQPFVSQVTSPSLAKGLKINFARKIGRAGAGKGQFSQPKGLTIAQGLIFIADTQNQRIQVFSKFGDWQYLIQSNNEHPLKGPCSIAVDSSGKVYVVDAPNSRISIFDQYGRFINSFGKHGQIKGQFSNPYGISISKNGSIYLVDTDNSRIQVLDVNGQVHKILGKPGKKPGEFKSPYAITLDSKENIYILDYGIPRVQVLDRHGICRLSFGSRGVHEGEFSIPRGLAIDKKGRIYVADTLNHRVQIFDSKGRWLHMFGNKGRNEGQFWGPESIAVNDEGEIFVLDKGNSRVQVFECENW